MMQKLLSVVTLVLPLAVLAGSQAAAAGPGKPQGKQPQSAPAESSPKAEMPVVHGDKAAFAISHAVLVKNPPALGMDIAPPTPRPALVGRDSGVGF